MFQKVRFFGLFCLSKIKFLIGWIGIVLVLIVYALLSTNKVNNGILYQILNLVAGIGVLLLYGNWVIS